MRLAADSFLVCSCNKATSPPAPLLVRRGVFGLGEFERCLVWAKGIGSIEGRLNQRENSMLIWMIYCSINGSWLKNGVVNRFATRRR